MKSGFRFARTTGFTVAELIIVIAIILIVAALAHPVILRAGLRAKEAKCVTNLRQIHLAISLYRESYGGDGVYGEVEQMGLPPSLGHLYPSYVTSRDVYQCSMGERWQVYTRMFPGDGPATDPRDGLFPPWLEYVTHYREDSILIMDRHHDWGARGIESPYLKRRAIGLYLGGHVRTLVRYGNPNHRLWWNPE